MKIRLIISSLRWFARFASIALIAWIVFLLLWTEYSIWMGYISNKHSTGYYLHAIFLLVESTGLIIAWKREGSGAGITIFGYFCDSILTRNFWMPPFYPYLIISFLFLISWTFSDNNGKKKCIPIKKSETC